MNESRFSLNGTVLGEKYKLIDRLGKGGMGSVYRAEHLFLEKQYAVKIILPEHIEDAHLIERFRQEAKATSELEHENIVRVFDYGEVEEDWRLVLAYIVMEILEGKSLKDLLHEEPEHKLQPSRAVNLMIQICEGVNAAHEKGIISRDIKPDNVMVIPPKGRKGETAKVIDFGIAKRLYHGADLSLTNAGMPIGSPYYMAPEQWQDSSTVNHLCDIYGLGVMLFEISTGHLPFKEGKLKGFEALAFLRSQHLEKEPQIELVPESLRRVVVKAMKKRPAERYQSVSEMCDDLVDVGARLYQMQPLQHHTIENSLPKNEFATRTDFVPNTIAAPKDEDVITDVPNKPGQTQEQVLIPYQNTHANPHSFSSTTSVETERKKSLFSSVGAKVALGLVAASLLFVIGLKVQSLLDSNPSQTNAQTLTTQTTSQSNTRPHAEKIETSTAPTSEQYVETLPEEIKLEMVKVPVGSFEMGSPDTEVDRDDNEGPIRRVNIGYNIYFGKYEITQEQWRVVMSDEPSHFKECDNCPVDNITWLAADEFCKKLSQMTGRTYRLPSEAEWEYAARAGTKTAFYFGDSLSSTQANFDGNYPYGNAVKDIFRNKTTPVGSFQPNSFGLFDMHGNVREWCEDFWHDSYVGAPTNGSGWLTGGDGKHRVMRGGSWFLNAKNCRSAARFKVEQESKLNIAGFRVVMVVGE